MDYQDNNYKNLEDEFDKIYNVDGSLKYSLSRLKDESEEDWGLRIAIKEILNKNYPWLSSDEVSNQIIQCIILKQNCSQEVKNQIYNMLPTIDSELANLNIEEWIKKIDLRIKMIDFVNEVNKWVNEKRDIKIYLDDYILIRERFGDQFFNNMIYLLRDKKLIKSIILNRLKK